MSLVLRCYKSVIHFHHFLYSMFRKDVINMEAFSGGKLEVWPYLFSVGCCHNLGGGGREYLLLR